MSEIRPIRAGETDEFLELLCKVFGLDLKAARTIFYQEPLFDLNRKWALFDQGRMLSILTTSPLSFGWGRAAGIAGVATIPEARGRGLAEKVMRKAMEASRAQGEEAFILFATDARLYEKIGYKVVDEVIRGEISASSPADEPRILEQAEVREIYTKWAAESPDRMIRTERKWEAWTWTLKHCEARLGGYVCIEPVLLRESILPLNVGPWPVPKGTIFYGMKRTAEVIGVPIMSPRKEMLVMTLGFPQPPVMFMTDQF
jgi:predicted acetyltransferase